MLLSYIYIYIYIYICLKKNTTKPKYIGPDMIEPIYHQSVRQRWWWHCRCVGSVSLGFRLFCFTGRLGQRSQRTANQPDWALRRRVCALTLFLCSWNPLVHCSAYSYCLAPRRSGLSRYWNQFKHRRQSRKLRRKRFAALGLRKASRWEAMCPRRNRQP